MPHLESFSEEVIYLPKPALELPWQLNLNQYYSLF